MTITVYKTRSGAQLSFTDQQKVALTRAGEWSHGLIYLHADVGQPTQTNAEIVRQIRKYERLTHIGILHPLYRHPAQTFFVRNPKQFEADGTAPNIQLALECASREFRCDIVTVNQSDFQDHFNQSAADCGVLLLVI